MADARADLGAVDPQQVETAAEAMADADDGIIFGLLTPDEAEFYRRMAVAAIEALDMRAEWCVGVVYPPREDYPGATVPQQPWPIASREAAELYKRDKYPDDCYTIHRRLVGPWRTAQ